MKGGKEIEHEEEEKIDKGIQKKERWKRILSSKYNKWYKFIKEEGMPGYLKKKWNASRMRGIVRYRLGNEVKEGRYWMTEEERKCRLCHTEEETWKYVWEVCGRSGEEERGWQENIEKILGEEGQGEDWLKKMDEKRSEGQERGADGVEEQVLESEVEEEGGG